jgi:hypothetical protein
MRWDAYVACAGEVRNEHSILIEKPEGNMPLGRPKRRWENNIKVDLNEICVVVKWTELA